MSTELNNIFIIVMTSLFRFIFSGCPSGQTPIGPEGSAFFVTQNVFGDQVKGGNEQCDGNDLGNATCATVLGSSYSGGTLRCKSDCTFDTSGCMAISDLASGGAGSGGGGHRTNRPTLVSIRITPSDPSIAVATTQQFEAQGTFSDGDIEDLTNEVSWNSSDASVATISNSGSDVGLATGHGEGTSEITATYGSASDSTTLTVALNSATNTPAANTPPTISSIADQTIPTNGSTSALGFIIGDAETSAAELALTADSNNPTLAPLANIVLGGSGTNRTITVIPAANQFGSATITLTVTDASNASTSTSFLLSVTPAENTPPSDPNDPGTAPQNTAPTISNIADQVIAPNHDTGALSFTVGDVETPAADLTLTAASDNLTLVPIDNVVFGGSGADRNVTVTPAADQSGLATITITVTDGNGQSASTTFMVIVSTRSGQALSDCIKQCSGPQHNECVFQCQDEFSPGEGYLNRN